MKHEEYLAARLTFIKEKIQDFVNEKIVVEDELMNLMEQEEQKTIILDDVRITKIETNKVIYDITKMKEILDKVILKQVCDKDVSVDTTELRQLFRDKPEMKKILSGIIKVSYTPNAKKIQQATDGGLIGSKILKKIASIKISRYIKTTLQEDE